MAGQSQELTVSPEADGDRLDRYVSECFPTISRSAIKDAIKSGKILLAGQEAKPSSRVSSGQSITLPEQVVLEQNKDNHLEPVEMDLQIIHQDEDVLVLNKPAGIAVHPGAGTRGATLVQGVMASMSNDLLQHSERPGVVHRLDKDTTGVMVFALNRPSLANLSEQFKDKTNKREYVALLLGKMEPHSQTITSWLTRDPHNRIKFVSLSPEEMDEKFPDGAPPGYRKAVSRFELLRHYFDRLSLVKVTLDTGRTHQIRIHAGSIGLPVIGDSLYCGPLPKLSDQIPKEVRRLLAEQKRQLLHARILGFNHPRTGDYQEFNVGIPEDFAQIIRAAEQQ